MNTPTERGNEIRRIVEGRIVEAKFFSCDNIVIAKFLQALGQPQANAIIHCVLGWVDHRKREEDEGRRVTCGGCKEEINDEVKVGGFIIIIPFDEGGFEAVEAHALCTCVCGRCCERFGDNVIEEIMERTLGSVTEVHVAPTAPGSQEVN